MMTRANSSTFHHQMTTTRKRNHHIKHLLFPQFTLSRAFNRLASTLHLAQEKNIICSAAVADLVASSTAPREPYVPDILLHHILPRPADCTPMDLHVIMTTDMFEINPQQHDRAAVNFDIQPFAQLITDHFSISSQGDNSRNRFRTVYVHHCPCTNTNEWQALSEKLQWAVTTYESPPNDIQHEGQPYNGGNVPTNTQHMYVAVSNLSSNSRPNIQLDDDHNVIEGAQPKAGRAWYNSMRQWEAIGYDTWEDHHKFAD